MAIKEIKMGEILSTKNIGLRRPGNGLSPNFMDKILTVPGKDKILGVTIVGYHAAELIGEFVMAMTHGMGLGKISAVTHIYPTLYEANKFAANAWRSARLPTKLFPWTERFFRWRR